MIASTLATDSAFVLVYPHGFELGPVACARPRRGRDRASRGAVSRTPPMTPGVGVVYLIDEERLLALGPRTTVEQRARADREARSRRRPSSSAARGSSQRVARGEPARRRLARRARSTAPPSSPPFDAAGRRRCAGPRASCAPRAARASGCSRSASRSRPNATSRKLHQTIVRNARELTRADSGSPLPARARPERRTRRCASPSRRPVPTTPERTSAPCCRSRAPRSPATSRSAARPSASTTPTRFPPSAEYRFNRSFDNANGYRTKSVLAVPMRDHEDAIVGVIMLINRKPDFHLVLTSPAIPKKSCSRSPSATRTCCSRSPRKPASRSRTRRCSTRSKISSNSSCARR